MSESYQYLSTFGERYPEIKQLVFLLEKMNQVSLTKEEYLNLQRLLFIYEGWFRFGNTLNYSYPVCKTSITGDRIMFIADTHFGNSEFVSDGLVYTAYCKALQQNIKTVIHVGDLTDACAYSRVSNKKYEEVLEELKTALRYMPDDITTKLLLGNHDYSAIRKHPEIIEHYFENPKLDILGMKKVILNWDGQANICIGHSIQQLKSSITKEYDDILTIEGHHHVYRFMEQQRCIHLPTLTSEALRTIYVKSSERYKDFRPVFLIASKQGDNYLLFEIYCAHKSNINNIVPFEEIGLDTKTRQLKLRKVENSLII